MPGPLAAITTALTQSLNFSGRASRSEFWWAYGFFMLLMGIAIAADLAMITMLVGTSAEQELLSYGPFDYYSTPAYLVTFVPTLSLSIRRLHDIGMSGFVWLLGCIPVVGWLIMWVIYAMPSVANATRHGKPRQTQSTTPFGKQARRSKATAATPATLDKHQRAMQGYALLFEKDREATPDMLAARKAEISEYYRARVLKPAPGT